MKRLMLGLACVMALGSVRGMCAEPLNYQKMTEGARWGWSAEKASLLFSILHDQGDYRIELIREKGDVWGVTLRFLDAQGGEVWSLPAHQYTVFAQYDGILYYADFGYSSSGCAIVAYDLRNKTQLWKTSLQAVGDVLHSSYLNMVTMDVGEDVIGIYGNESLGRYLEYVDRKTGVTVGHRVFCDEKPSTPPPSCTAGAPES